MRPVLTALFALLLCLPGIASAQSAAPPPPPVPSPVVSTAPAADPKDVASLDAIVAALYDVISGPKGQARDFRRMRSLFVPEARMLVVMPQPDGGTRLREMRVNDYIATSGPALVERGFSERELARKTEQFGDLAHVFSTYEGRTQAGEVMRGINSIQLLRDGGRWWIVSVFWQAEHGTLTLPPQYLPKPAGKR